MSEDVQAPTPPALPSSWSLILTLGSIAMISGLFVVLAYQLTLPRITLNRQRALEKAIFTVLPNTTSRTNLLLDETGLTLLPDEAFAQANVFAGYLMPIGRTANKLQWLCSLLLLLAPTLFAWSFFTEVSQDSLDRPVAKIALFSLFAAAVILLTDACVQQVRTQGRDQT